jgi:hypothetical protein
MSTVVLAYWAPIYVTIDTERREVVNVRLVTKGMRNGVRIAGQPASGQRPNVARRSGRSRR